MRRALGSLAHRLFPALTRNLLIARTLARARRLRATAVDAAGAPLPWYTYPAIEYLSQLDARELSVFEFGAGNSSLYWAARAQRVRSVENDRGWHAKVAAHRLPNLEVLLREDQQSYVGCLAEQGERFDLIAIDGRWRRACARAAPAHLKEGGLLLFDNTDWYPRTAAELRAGGFLQVDFSGFGPVNGYAWTTSIFLRADTRLQRGFRPPLPIGGERHDDVEEDR
jgi:hypothetical protein